jgi:hypothetical protein
MSQKLSFLGLRRVSDMGCRGSGQFSVPVASVRDGNLEWRNSGIFVKYLDLVPFL